jgi:endoglucanase
MESKMSSGLVKPRRSVRAVATVTLVVGSCLIPAAASANPMAGARLYVGPNANAARTAEQWRRARPHDAAAMDFISRQPVAYWVGGWGGAVRQDVAAYVSRASAARAAPVLVAYNIPHRDCGSHSKGGAGDADRYRAWIREFARGLSGRAVVVLEPDAIAAADCLGFEERSERFALIRDAVAVLKRAGAAVYIDAGHARWHSAEEMARRLTAAGVQQADGFALNVSNYIDNRTSIAYGEQLSRRVGGKGFVIDTSRNGSATAPAGAWCNVPGQALGTAPTTATGHRLVHAFLWIKLPGESDGRCSGGPAAGQWWPEYALGLAKRSPLVLASR